MLLLWSIRYLDRTDMQFKDRHLYLDTKTLSRASRAAVELVAENESAKTDWDILKYRPLFVEGTPEQVASDSTDWDKVVGVGPSEYFEDETGRAISNDEMARILTGSPSALAIPRGAKQHDIDFMLSEPKPVPVAEVTLPFDQLRLVGYFVRDLKELIDSAFMKDGPGKIKAKGTFALTVNSNHTLETAVTDEEIRSFVTIFRRLYMTGPHDPASFAKVVPIFTRILDDHPYSKWVAGVAEEYQNCLNTMPDRPLFLQRGTPSFTTKRLIDVFLYTQYAHQPDEKRQQQFRDCLSQVCGNHHVLTWMFLTEMWHLSRMMIAASKIVSWWFRLYCEQHSVYLMS